MKILYIAYNAPYTKVAHAGGQTLNYYIKNLSKESQFEVSLITYAEPNEIVNISNDVDEIKKHLIIRRPGIKRFIGRICSIWSKYYPLHKCANLTTSYSNNMLIRELKYMKEKDYTPDIVILEWTQMLLLIEEIKKIYPNAKYVASEHDVTFLGVKRKAVGEKNRIKSKWKYIQYENTKRRELHALDECDLIFTHNEKDKKLLIDNGLCSEKIQVEIPYYHISKMNWRRKNNDILFFGSMSREENEVSVIWFIENVMPLIEELPSRFVIIGGGVSELLKKYESDKIHFTGYVDSIDHYFSEAMCFVAPLQLGAGIKVKVLEAFCTGIPVITNEIGIEGIPARDKINYLHAETPHEFADAIFKIFSNDIVLDSKGVVNDRLSISKSFENYVTSLLKLGE